MKCNISELQKIEVKLIVRQGQEEADFLKPLSDLERGYRSSLVCYKLEYIFLLCSNQIDYYYTNMSVSFEDEQMCKVMCP